jgi:predicted AlkP superfamily phosphohydrolase/phosphomutase
MAFAFPSTAEAYIDPQTTQTVVTGLGAILATLGGSLVFAGAFLRAKFHMALRLVLRREVLVITSIFTLSVARFATQSEDSADQRPGGSDVSKNRLIILGIDGMDPVITSELMLAGRLPSLTRLADTGDFQMLTTVNPVQSPVVWTTMATGVGPGRHGIIDFIRRKERSYIPDLALVKAGKVGFLDGAEAAFQPPVDPQVFFWERLARAGIPARVLRWPLTFPASGSAKVLSGLGTPDIAGRLGRYTLFTTRSPEHWPDAKGDIIPLQLRDGVAHAVLSGPALRILGTDTHAKLPITIRRAATGVTVTIDATKHMLEEGRATPWIKLPFRVGLLAKADSMAHLLLLENDDELSLYVSPLELDPAHPYYPIATQSLAEELAQQIGSFHTLGMAEDTNALGDGVLDDQQFLASTEALLDESERLFWHGLDSQPTGLYSYVFDPLDRIQHMFWRFRDKRHALHEADGDGKDVIARSYERMDRIVGKLLTRLDPSRDTLIIVSDHGFADFRRSLHVNAWLVKEGYMRVEDPNAGIDGLFRGVDWSKTKAFAIGFSQIFLNRKGREPHGVVTAEEASALKHELRDKLLALRDPMSGEAPVEEVYDAGAALGIGEDVGPDLVVGLKRGYRFSWQTAVGGAPAHIFEDNAKKWSGDHCIDAQFVPGVIFSNRKIVTSTPSVFDVAPTALRHFGLDAPAEWPGRALF